MHQSDSTFNVPARSRLLKTLGKPLAPWRRFGPVWLLILFLPVAHAIDERVDPVQALGTLLNIGQVEDGLVEPDQAYILSVTAADPRTLVAHWTIDPCCYLYKDKIEFELLNAAGVSIESVEMSPGQPKEDEFYGIQEVFYGQATATVRLQRDSAAARDMEVKVDYQGCADIGICYPPLSQTIPVTLAAATNLPPSSTPAAVEAPPAASAEPAAMEAEQDRMARMLVQQHFWSLPAFFGFGLLLAFTPCVFPMVPILSSLIVGQGKALTQRRAFLLSLVYVLAMALTYSVAGVMAALLGQNVQASFQNPWVIGAFSALFALLALSMFGFYELRLPNRWQSRLTEFSNRQHGGSYLGVAIMGLFSALIVGPCVAPPLIGVLTVIATTGDALLGGTALFALSLGMGAPLLVIGASAGRLLPHAGLWMERIKAVFGVLLLAVAIWMLERILPAPVIMLLWALLLIVSATFVGVLQPVSPGKPTWRLLVKGLGVVMLVYGILLLVGVAAGGRDPLQPLKGVGFMASDTMAQEPARFRAVKTIADLERELDGAHGRYAMLDFYADWCVSCKELEKYTFPAPEVQAALADMVLLRADVTANDDADQALLRRFGIIGPPALLFFDASGNEHRPYRVVGFMSAGDFKAHLERMTLRTKTLTLSQREREF